MQVDWDSLHEQRGICTHATYLEAVLGTCVARWVDQRLSTLCCFDHLSVGAASSGYDADCIVLEGKEREAMSASGVHALHLPANTPAGSNPWAAKCRTSISSACISWLHARKASQCKSYSN